MRQSASNSHSKTSYKICPVVKAIIFVEWRVTALYLKQVLHNAMRSLRVACTVTPSGQLKPFHERAALRSRLAPKSNDLGAVKDELDILICTDADGIGVNLQDADTVINYDLGTGADLIVQRLGRILRATPEQRERLYTYTFVPSCLHDSVSGELVYRRIRERYARLFSRHKKSSSILGSRILAANGAANGRTTIVNLDDEVETASFLNDSDPIGTTDQQKLLATHLSILEGYRQRAEALPHTLHRACREMSVEGNRSELSTQGCCVVLG